MCVDVQLYLIRQLKHIGVSQDLYLFSVAVCPPEQSEGATKTPFHTQKQMFSKMIFQIYNRKNSLAILVNVHLVN